MHPLQPHNGTVMSSAHTGTRVGRTERQCAQLQYHSIGHSDADRGPRARRRPAHALPAAARARTLIDPAHALHAHAHTRARTRCCDAHACPPPPAVTWRAIAATSQVVHSKNDYATGILQPQLFSHYNKQRYADFLSTPSQRGTRTRRGKCGPAAPCSRLRVVPGRFSRYRSQCRSSAHGCMVGARMPGGHSELAAARRDDGACSGPRCRPAAVGLRLVATAEDPKLFFSHAGTRTRRRQFRRQSGL